MTPIRSLPLVVTLVFATGASGAGGSMHDVLREFGIADQQRMLSQRMALAACLVMAGVDPKTNAALALHSADGFDAGLTEDDTDGSGTAAPDLWRQFGPAVRQVASGDYNSVAIRQFLHLNTPLLEIAEARVDALLAAQAGNDGHTALLRTLALAGRQRMLAQRLAKEACLVTVEIEIDVRRAALIDAVAEFENALVTLEEADGANGILGPPDENAEDQLWMLRGEWDAITERLAGIGDGAAMSRDALTLLTQGIVQLMAECETLAAMYLPD